MKIFGRIAAIVGTVLFAVVAVLIASGVGLWERADAGATPTLYPKTALQETAAIVTPTPAIGQQLQVVTPTSTLMVVEATATQTTPPASSTPVPVLPTETSVSAATAEPTPWPTYPPYKPYVPVTITKSVEQWPMPDVGLEMHWGDVVEISYPNANRGWACDNVPNISIPRESFATLESFCPDPDTKTLRFSFPYQESVHSSVFDMTITEGRQGTLIFKLWVKIYVPRYGFN